jgi:hypothetical protein
MLCILIVMFTYSYCYVLVSSVLGVLFTLLFCVLFLCKCVLYYCHLMSTQLRLLNISYQHNFVKRTTYGIFHVL